jgi:hypothetical protein
MIKQLASLIVAYDFHSEYIDWNGFWIFLGIVIGAIVILVVASWAIAIYKSKNRQ